MIPAFTFSKNDLACFSPDTGLPVLTAILWAGTSKFFLSFPVLTIGDRRRLQTKEREC
jgi:hypothetical protein